MGTDGTQGRRRRWPVVVAGTSVLGAGALVAALVGPLGSSPAAATELTSFEDCGAFERHMQNLALDRLVFDGPGGGRKGGGGLLSGREVRAGEEFAVGGAPAAAAPDAAAAAPQALAADAPAGNVAADAAAPAATSERAPAMASKSSSAQAAVGNDASGTNTQEAGVDEADLAKTDGRLLVTVLDGRLTVMDVSGRAPRARGSVELDGQNPQELLLAGDRALVVGTPAQFTKYRGERDAVEGGPLGGLETTSLSLVDLSDPDRPVVRASEEISARYLSARMTGDTVRVVLSTTPDLGRYWDEYYDDSYYDGDDFGFERDRSRTRLDDVRDRLSRIPAEDWLPTRRVVDREARTVDERPLLDCADVHYPVTDSGMDLLSVLSIDVAGGTLGDSLATGVVGSGDLVYASTDRLYVATTDGGWAGDWRGSRTSGTVTRVHSFDITDGAARYVASGRVDGYLYGRWAMDEHEGLLRMVTTSSPPWDGRGRTQTGVVVLDTTGDRMREIGRVDGMGFTETVRSVRWFDDVAALVTFRQTDPLYLVDVSNPQNPRVRGELKIPGYSAYLHPVGEHRLLGVGQDADRFGREQGLQLSSFDILDLSDPRRTDALFFGGGTSSSVEVDPRGFVYLPERGLAVLPVRVDNGYCGPRRCFNEVSPDVPAGLAFAPNEHGGSSTGLVAVRVEQDGDLTEEASWGGTAGRDVIKVMPLPDGRLAALNLGGVTLLDADSLTEYGFASYR